MFSPRLESRNMSTLNSRRPLNPVGVVAVLEDNLLNSSDDPRKAPNEIISLDHLIRAHATVGYNIILMYIYIAVCSRINTHKHTYITHSTRYFSDNIRIIIYQTFSHFSSVHDSDRPPSRSLYAEPKQ